MNTRMLVASSIVGLVLLAGQAFGQAVPAPAPRQMPSEELLAMQMASPDPAVAKQAVDRARLLLRTSSNREVPVNDLRRLWLKALQATNRYEEVADLAYEGAIARAEDTPTAEDLLQIHIRALLRLGKADQALIHAKSLYNLCSMKNTRQAIDLLSECLYAARQDINLVHQFRLQQVNGSLPPSPGQSAAKSVLADIKIDPTRYLERAKEFAAAEQAAPDEERRFKAVMGRANLLLMADQAKDARPVFEKAYSVAEGDQMLQAAEGIARAIRAEDVAVARANEWIRTGMPGAAAK